MAYAKAEEIVQETFAAMFSRYEEIGLPKAYAFRVANRLALQDIRKYRAEWNALRDNLRFVAGTHDPADDYHEQFESVVMPKLSLRDRKFLELFVRNAPGRKRPYRHREIAALLGYTPAYITIRKQRLIQKARQIVRGHA